MNSSAQETTFSTNRFIPELKADEIKQLQIETASSLNLPVVFSDKLKSGISGPELTIIPAGQFEMGSSGDEYGHRKEEYPPHYTQIRLPYAIGRFTITADDFEQFCKDTEFFIRPDLICSQGKEPVINVRLADANLYIEWLSEQTGENYRLPTEAEWEFAARAGTSTAFHFGDDVTCKEVHFHSLFPYNEAKQNKRWFLPKCSPMATVLEVGTKPANTWGLHDVHGNIWEFTNTHWKDTHLYNNRDGNDYSDFISASYVTKGGSWFDEAIHSRSASRKKRLFDEMDTNLGFRVVRDLVDNDLC